MQHPATKIVAALLLCSIHASSAANILAILPMPSRSHHIWNSPLLVALAGRGHNVTVVSPIGQKTPVPNLTDLVITGAIEATDLEFDYDALPDLSHALANIIFFAFMGEQCPRILAHEAWARLMSSPAEARFDLVIVEAIGAECLLPALRRFGDPPIVAVNAFNAAPWMFSWSGTPHAMSHIPNFNLPATDRMSFWERLGNVLINAQMLLLYRYHYLPEMDRLAREYFGPDAPSFREIEKKICLSMPSIHPAFDYPYATSPSLIPVAGIHLKEPKPLPKDLQDFLDSATEGAIYFSLGSNVKTHKLNPQRLSAMLEAFAELPQKVLWKIEVDSLPGQPKNVKTGKWLPQTDILAHPNVKVFISHSGLLSTHEAIYRGVPVLGIPFYSDQPVNVEKLARHGAGLRLDYRDVTKESLLAALRKILHDPSYRENMRALSARFRDDPQTPLERAVFWTEYALRHGGAPHLRSGGQELNALQYLLVDVLALLLALPSLLAAALYCLCCRRTRAHGAKQKKN